jgi:hypothetical protein
MRIAVLANLKKNAPKWEGMPDDQWDDLDAQLGDRGSLRQVRAAVGDDFDLCHFTTLLK